MAHFDVFNGDADGLCSLHQLRLAEPREAILLTGVKRDVGLLARVPAVAGDSATVLDVSLATNRGALAALLERGVAIEYFDHHFAGEVPRHPRLQTFIDSAADVCTGVLIDRHIGGRYRPWAIVAAFGDNMDDVAQTLAGTVGLEPTELALLRELGACLAYNAYGETEADLIVHPVELYETLHRYADPFGFMATEAIFERIGKTRQADLNLARQVEPMCSSDRVWVYCLPDAPWSRRVRGALGNELASTYPDRAHAVLTPNAVGGYTVSVRASLATRAGADALCRHFSTGGGRAAAAGINHLPKERLQDFLQQLESAYG